MGFVDDEVFKPSVVGCGFENRLESSGDTGFRRGEEQSAGPRLNGFEDGLRVGWGVADWLFSVPGRASSGSSRDCRSVTDAVATIATTKTAM